MLTLSGWSICRRIVIQAEDAHMARVCRQQAALASTREVHAALIALAEHYEGKKPKKSVDPTEPLAEQFE
jgi:hypothetical protein